MNTLLDFTRSRGQLTATLLLMVVVCGALASTPGAFQPHPSHAPPPPPAAPPPAAPRKAPPPKVVKMVNPDYPRGARDYNAQKVVALKIEVEASGRVRAVEVLNDDGPFGENARRAALKWRFEDRPEPSSVRLAVPFRIAPDEAARVDTAVRRMTYQPKAAADVPRPLTFGFQYVRLRINPDGTVAGRFVEHTEPAEFAPSADAILAAVRFEGAEADTLEGGMTLNSFLVDFASDGIIRIQQRSGLPAY